MRISAQPAAAETSGPGEALTAQSLASGLVGDALLAIEQAWTGDATWRDAHAALAATLRFPVAATSATSLYLGVPAIAFAFHTADGGIGRFSAQLAALNARTDSITRQRLSDAHARIEAGLRPRTSEYDLFYGLTGLGAYYLAHRPSSQQLRAILAYLVRLVRPIRGDQRQLPGWWTLLDPNGRISAEFPSGHLNFGMAHGISGPLTLMSASARHGITTKGLPDAITQICSVLDAWRQEGPAGPWWPGWLTLPEHTTGQLTQTGPRRPSWCYGTPGLARAQQLAGIALEDKCRQDMASRALQHCLTDPDQLSKITDATLCHGTAGILTTAHHAARDASPGSYAPILRDLRSLHDNLPPLPTGGLLEGSTGRALATVSEKTAGYTASGWDACILPMARWTRTPG
jgi:hypothetical protein